MQHDHGGVRQVEPALQQAARCTDAAEQDRHRHNPLAIVPVAILLGGIGASGGLLQRRLDLPDAAVIVLQGIIFVAILASETLYGRLWKPKAAT